MRPGWFAVVLVAAATALLAAPLAHAVPAVPTIDSGPIDGSTIADPTPTFTFSSPGATGFTCSIAGPTIVSPTACFGTFTPVALSNGAYTFSVTASDGGGTSGAASRTFTLAVPPPPPTISGPSGSITDDTPTFTFSSAGATGYTCSIAGPTSVPPTTCDLGTFTAPTLVHGPYTFSVSASNPSGTSAPTTRSFTLTVPPPPPTIDAGPSGTTIDTTPTFTFSSAGATGYTCSIAGPTSVPPTTCDLGTFTAPTLTDGAYTFSVTATDANGTSAPATRSFTVDTQGPDTSITTAVPATITTTALSIAFTATGGATSFECKLDAGAFAACTSPANLAGLTDGSHTFSVRASDGVGNVDPTPATATWSVDATAPGSGGPGGPVLSGPGNLTVEADGPAGTIVTFVVSGSDGGLALLPGAVSCAPSSGTRFPLGRTTVTCNATGNVGSLSFSVTVVDTTAPVINAPNASFAATSALGLARTDPAIAAYLSGISATDLVSSATLTTTTPETLPIGATTITVTAHDAAGNRAQKTVTLTVLAPGTRVTAFDLTPPRAVRRLTATPGDHTIVLKWTKPAAKDLASIKVIRSIVGQKQTTTVYNGLRNTFTSRGLRNGVVYRFVIVAIDRAGNTSKSVVVTESPAAPALASPQAGARVATAPSLRWARVATAKYYNVQLYLNSTKVLSAWPATTRLQLTRRWSYDGKTHTLKPGRYTWYVWPGVGGRAAAVYGPLLGKSTFVVTPVKV